ncbi:hypothetical protein NEOKW01_1713 [Nematocida sp. AWRm80]|nr:hypothetical protein NEOKW01_1713 [Nematocida sp. AWRm80]
MFLWAVAVLFWIIVSFVLVTSLNVSRAVNILKRLSNGKVDRRKAIRECDSICRRVIIDTADLLLFIFTIRYSLLERITFRYSFAMASVFLGLFLMIEQWERWYLVKVMREYCLWSCISFLAIRNVFYQPFLLSGVSIALYGIYHRYIRKRKIYVNEWIECIMYIILYEIIREMAIDKRYRFIRTLYMVPYDIDLSSNAFLYCALLAKQSRYTKYLIASAINK